MPGPQPAIKYSSLALGVSAALGAIGLGGAALGQEATAPAAAPALSADGVYILNTLLFLVMGFLVMWMAAGFAMLEAGMVRSRNVAMQCIKNISLYSVAGLMFWAIGYNLMYAGVDGGYFGSFLPKIIPDPSQDAGDYAAGSDWFFQMVFAAATASIVSGTVAERIKLWPFLIFTALLTGLIYPVVGAWKWGEGWLHVAGFNDFAGSTLVHSTGGWAALTGAIILGARTGKYGKGGSVNPMPGSSMPLATLGTFILWLGWFGFNGGSQLALGTIEDASSISRIFVNTNLAAAGGVIAAMILTQLTYGKVDLTMALNGALAGLVSITAEPLMPTPLWAIFIGAVGGVIVIVVVPMLDKLKIDDVVGAIPVHLGAGIWGTLAVVLTNPEATIGAQLLGIGAIGAFVVVASSIVWLVLKATIGIRVSAEDEMIGLDKAELGMEAYPEFGQGAGRL
ncbi:Ammonium transporter [hydrothermal vent metagenome]|uniref:Ammonium transporter n=1 Tax=hydrothermal vent metagenome TaxID=652676 RepID=A0A3B0TW84_9ZZZZ